MPGDPYRGLCTGPPGIVSRESPGQWGARLVGGSSQDIGLQLWMERNTHPLVTPLHAHRFVTIMRVNVSVPPPAHSILST